jgi:hypothetical protein
MSAKTSSKPRINRVTTQSRPVPTHAEIALCAMTIWQAEGQPQGRDVEHWLKAEARLSKEWQAGTTAATGDQPRRARQTNSHRAGRTAAQ